ncbi:NAD(P)-binding protein [Leucogyrophana mollusca]|uniref:NAD(P)-binding protein n=1 Tax=Leucogyrophana mollusca TaxID=85980 RepID=A0ACB8BTC6_9AGAM|nr:NAD(P)-binding protein [Leucogyrophana mollusca]
MSDSEETYKSIAVLGIGTVAAPLIEAGLLANNASVLVITRPSPKARQIPEGAHHAAIDYTDVSALTAAFRKHSVEVVVSTVNHEALDVQPAVAEAAKKAGVKLFVPSEYGLPSAGHTEGVLLVKSRFVDSLVAAGLPYARLYVGGFIEWIPYLFAINETGKFNIIGEGKAPATFTAISDIAGFLAYVLTHLPPSQLHNVSFRIQGERKTPRELAALYGDKAPLVEISEFPPSVKDGAFRKFLQVAFNAGFASTGYDAAEGKDDEKRAGSSNSLWPGHQWKTVKEVLNL